MGCVVDGTAMYKGEQESPLMGDSPTADLRELVSLVCNAFWLMTLVSSLGFGPSKPKIHSQDGLTTVVTTTC